VARTAERLQKSKDEGGGMKDESAIPQLESAFFHPSSLLFNRESA
jgi:hypothetical protein